MSSGAAATVMLRKLVATVDRGARRPPAARHRNLFGERSVVGHAPPPPPAHMSRIAALTLALCALLAAALPAAAFASHSQSMTFEAPVDLADPATRASAFDE